MLLIITFQIDLKNMKNKILLIGSGGHAQSCIEIIESQGKFIIEKIYDPFSNNEKLYEYQIEKQEDYLINYHGKISNLFLAIGYIKDPSIREKYIDLFTNFNFTYPNIVSKTSYISNRSKLGFGNSFHHYSFINSNAEIGNFNIINSGAIIEHGVKIGNNCHISTNVVINGQVEIGNNTFIGSGSVLMQGIKIGNNQTIPMGTLLKDNNYE